MVPVSVAPSQAHQAFSNLLGFRSLEIIRMLRTLVTTKYWTQQSMCVTQIWSKMSWWRITSVFMLTNKTSVRNLIHWWCIIRLRPRMTVGARHELYWHHCWPCSRCAHCFHCWTIAARSFPSTWKRFRWIKIWKRKHLPPDSRRKMWFVVRLASIRNASPMWNPNSVIWERKYFSLPQWVASNWCWCPFVQFYVMFYHSRKHFRIVRHVKLRRNQFHFVLYFCRFVPSEVDKWFRELIHELKEDRMKSPPQHEDLFQMLLNCSDKHGKKTPSLY